MARYGVVLPECIRSLAAVLAGKLQHVTNALIKGKKGKGRPTVSR